MADEAASAEARAHSTVSWIARTVQVYRVAGAATPRGRGV